jgi:4-hydroxy-2-oxoheptanedioate aldolase
VSAAKFGSKINGTRSAPPGRWLPGLSQIEADPTLTFWENLNQQAAIVIQIESLEGINNLDEILTELGEHIDSVWLGTLDARVSMSLPGLGGEEPEWIAAVKKYNATLKKHNKGASGFSMGPPEVRATLSRGKSFVVVASDFYAIMGEAGGIAQGRADNPAQDFGAVYKKEW